MNKKLSNKLKKIISNIFIYTFMVFIILVSVGSLIWVLMSSFKSNAEILNSPFSLPSSIGFSQYAYLFEEYDFVIYFFNSLFVSLISTLVSLIIYSMAAYVIARYRFPMKNMLFVLFTITLLVPGQAKAQPIFTLVSKLGMYDTLIGLTIVYLSFGLAMSIFILRNSFMTIPKTLDEAAMIEGASFFRIFWQIDLPLAKNGLLAAGLVMFINNWNEYFYAALLTSSNNKKTLPLALQFFTETFSYDYTKLFAALSLVIIPGIIVYLIFQSRFRASSMSSGVKG